MNFGANLYKNQIDPGQLQFSLSGSNGVYTFIDDSSIVNKKSNVYNIISGSIIGGIPTPDVENGTVAYNSIGLFYPKTGTVILNGNGIYNVVGSMNLRLNFISESRMEITIIPTIQHLYPMARMV